MTNEILEYLEQLELTEGEAKLYLTLLKHGAMTVTALAKAAGVYRTAAYSPIDRLIEKGLAMELVKGSHILVDATNPEESLKQLVENKIQSAKAVEAKFSHVIQKINTKHPQAKPAEDAQIRYYKGINAVRKIHQEALKANELRAYAKLSETEEGKIFSENVTIFTEAFKQNPNLTIKEILYDSPLAKEKAPKLLSKNKRYSYKFMPKN